MNRFPIYVPSKGRSGYMMTSKALTAMGIEHFVVVEPQEVEAYKDAAVGLSVIVLPLDMSFKAKYELCDDLGMTKSTGPGPARNFIWEHSKAAGHAWHWVMDDNIRVFARLHKNAKIRVASAAFFEAMEDFTLRYKNIGMAGPNYCMFAKARQKLPPFITNTRIYSCNLIRNDLPFRWRGRYNEDTILSLDMLKAGWCTVQFNAFLQDKQVTQSLKGGNTAEFYHAEGTVKNGAAYADGGTNAKSEMLVRVHPDCCELVWKFRRQHHHVDYSAFKSTPLVRRPDASISKGVNSYGMTLKTVREDAE